MTKFLIALFIIFSLMLGILGYELVSAKSGGIKIELSTDPNPAQLGSNNFLISVKQDGKFIDNASVSFDLNMTTMNMGTQQGNMTSQGSGKYLSVGKLTMLGPWRFSVNVTMPDNSVIKKNFDLNISR